MADLQIIYKGRSRPVLDIIQDIEWDIVHGNRESARDGLNALQNAALQTDNILLREECLRLYAMLDSEQPSRTVDVGQPASSAGNLPPKQQPPELTEEQEKMFFRLAMIGIMDVKTEGTEKWLFSQKSLWKAPFRFAVDIGLTIEGENAYSKFEELAHEQHLDDPSVCRIPFSKSSIEDITQPRYEQFLQPSYTWTTEGLSGKTLGVARKMIAVKNLLKKRLEDMGVC